MKAKIICSIIVIISLTGCTTCPLSDVRKSASESGQVVFFTVNENYQSVYRHAAEKARMDFPAGAFLGGGFRVDADLYGELGFGEINVTFIPISKNILLIDIKKMDDKTAVTIFWNRWKLDANRIKDYLLQPPTAGTPQATTVPALPAGQRPPI